MPHRESHESDDSVGMAPAAFCFETDCPDCLELEGQVSLGQDNAGKFELNRRPTDVALLYM